MAKLKAVDMDRVAQIVAFESGLLEDDSVVQMFQAMIDDGSVWSFQGSYGRAAMDLLRAGLCVLGPVGHRDYWGNYVPSRYEVKPGTLGSLEYQERMGN